MNRHEYRKKPVVIEAFRVSLASLRGIDVSMLPGWLLGAIAEKRVTIQPDFSFAVDTLEGRVLDGKRGDWIIRGVEGELYPCDNVIFEKTYEAVEAPDADLTFR